MKQKLILFLAFIFSFSFAQAQWEEWGFEDCNNPWVLCNQDTETETEPDDDEDPEEDKKEDDDLFPKIKQLRDPWAPVPPQDPPPGENPPTNDPPTADPPKETPPPTGTPPASETPPSELKPWSYLGETEKNYILARKELNKRITIWDKSDKVKWKKNWTKTVIGSKKRVRMSSGRDYVFILQARKDHNLKTKDIYEVTYKVTWKTKQGRMRSSPLLLRVFPDKVVAYTKGR